MHANSQGDTSFIVFRYVRRVFHNRKVNCISLTSSNANSCHLRFPSSFIYPRFERIWFCENYVKLTILDSKNQCYSMHERLCNGQYSSALLEQLFLNEALFHLFHLYLVSTVRTHGQIFLEQTDVC